MAVLTIDYRHCKRHLPNFLQHPEVENVATLVRHQLGCANSDALSFSVLSSITAIKANGVSFDLWVETGYTVTDEQGNAVLGMCEFDPAASTEAAVLSVTPVCEIASTELVLSTFAHELGHAIFDAPGWIVEAAQGADLFSDSTEAAQKAYRTTTDDAEHLAKPDTPFENTTTNNSELAKSIHFAELRANEFMGSLLVPRRRLTMAIEELANQYGITFQKNTMVDPDIQYADISQIELDSYEHLLLKVIQGDLAKRFGVTPRFIQVRMDRYGLIQHDTHQH